jgi:hypothetical protein
MPITPSHVFPNLVIHLRLLQNLHIHLHHLHSLLLSLKTPLHLPQKGHSDLTQANWPTLFIPTRIHKNNTARVLEGARRQRGLEKQCLRIGVPTQALSRAVTARPEGRNDDYLRALPDQGTKCFRKAEIPAYQDADGAELRGDDGVRGGEGGGGEMSALWMPQV